MIQKLSVFCLYLILVFAVTGRVQGQPLPELTLDENKTTVSGLSSGAFMAVQVHVAFSGHILGAGVVAGGPYYCARGNLLNALNQCMQTSLGEPDEAALLAEAQTFAAQGKIDSLSGLGSDRVYLFSGTEDHTVTRPVMDAARDFYRAAGVMEADIQYRTDVPAGHAFLAEGAPNTCGVTAPDYINDCGVDQAGDILSWLYGDLAAPTEPDPQHLREFSQDAFLTNPESHGMDLRGFVYIPAACEAGQTCRLHISFHGCEQTADQINDLFARTAGYNRWAESNNIVVLYPQAQKIEPLANPKGCWDWWAYDDNAYFARNGRQMAAIAKMAAQLGAPISAEDQSGFCARHDAINWSHWMNGRAGFCGFTSVCAVGSGENLGPLFAATILFERPEGTFSTNSCE